MPAVAIAAALVPVGRGAEAGAQARAGAAAEDPALDSLRARFRITLPPGFAERPAFARTLPATNASTPSAYGPGWGDAFVGGGYQANTRASVPGGPLGREDGSVVAGFGVGRSDLLAGEVAFTSFSTFRSGFFYRTGVSLKVHHLFKSGWAVAAGRETAFIIGEAGDGGSASYGVVSRVFTRSRDSRRPFSSIGVSLGAGDGRFRPLADVRANRRTVGVFGAVSARLTDAAGLAADWNGQDLSVSLGLVPLRCVPLSITPGLTDLTRNAGNRPRFMLGMGMGIGRDIGTRVRECF